MAVRGFFSDTRLTLGSPPTEIAVPYVWCRVYLPNLDRRALVPFLIDTGADHTVLHPQDSLRLLGSDEIRASPDPIAFGGAGAGTPHHPLQAELVFLNEDQRSTFTVALTVFVAEPPHNEEVESLLGRDALDSFVMHFDQRARTITLGT